LFSRTAYQLRRMEMGKSNAWRALTDGKKLAFCKNLCGNIMEVTVQCAGADEFECGDCPKKAQDKAKVFEMDVKLMAKRDKAGYIVLKDGDSITRMRFCPGCNTPTERSGACFHMTCANCRNHWCWCCGEKFDSYNIYDHLDERFGTYEPSYEAVYALL